MNPSLSPDLQKVLDKLLEKSPARRFQNAEQLLEKIASLTNGPLSVDPAAIPFTPSSPFDNVKAPAITLPSSPKRAVRRRKRRIPASLKRLMLFLILAAIVLTVRAYLFQFLWVPSGSTGMGRTYTAGDLLCVNKRPGILKSGDVVHFRYPNDPGAKLHIGRIIAVGGTSIRMDAKGQVYVNEKPIKEPYVMSWNNNSPKPFGAVSLAANSYWVMNDNRDSYLDSRTWGAVPSSLIEGKVVRRIWPL